MKRVRGPVRGIKVALVGIAMGCHGPEYEVLERFFLANQRGDNETVAALSMVAFPEKLQDWNILEIGPARVEPYAVTELRQQVERAEDERDAQFKVFGEFRQRNYDDLVTIQQRLGDDPDHRFTGRLGELKERWDGFREERRQVVARLRDAEMELEREIRRVNKSLQRESTPQYLTGETLRKEALVEIVTETGEKLYRITLTRYDVRNQFGAVVPTRWIITDVTEADGQKDSA